MARCCSDNCSKFGRAFLLVFLLAFGEFRVRSGCMGLTGSFMAVNNSGFGRNTDLVTLLDSISLEILNVEDRGMAGEPYAYRGVSY